MKLQKNTMFPSTKLCVVFFSEFPAFQEHILSNGLCPLVVDIAKNDSEYYVRASALSCISQMVPVNMFWEQCFSALDLIVSYSSLKFTSKKTISKN